MIKVTYIGHSGFWVEWPDCIWLFDYYEGKLPDIPPEKPLYIFVSHFHADHFNPAIFQIQAHAGVTYILSHDVLRHRKISPEELPKDLYTMRPGQELSLMNGQLLIRTLHSTDFGVAFLVRFHGKWIYHAGDLNWWVWKEETKQYNHNMTANFKKYTAPLEGMELFAAFLPLDPRQEDWYDKGFLYILEHTKTAHVFPMHFWKDYEMISTFLASPKGSLFKKQVVPLRFEGQETIL